MSHLDWLTKESPSKGSCQSCCKNSFEKRVSFDGDSFVSQSRFEAYPGSTTHSDSFKVTILSTTLLIIIGAAS